MASFQVYNASAGSGKTHTLVKEYLRILLADDTMYPFRHILAMTFTNKAVYEMKARIIQHLTDFSESEMLQNPSQLFSALCSELGTDAETLHRRARNVLKQLLHNYAFFNIVTIDTFNHHILKTFAYDLRLPSNFEVGIDTGLLLEEAVDNFIYRAGDDELLTKTLVDFAVEKADDDKSWDIAIDLKKTAQLLLEENHYGHIEQLKNKNLESFAALNTVLRAEIKAAEKTLKTDAENMLKRIEEAQLDPSDFTRSTLLNHFKKIAAGDFKNLYNNKLAENLAEGKLHSKTLPEEKAAAIALLLPELSEAYHRLKKAVFHVKFLQNFYKNTVPLSLLSRVKNELELLKTEQNMVLISEFNSIISNAIANQPAPFIYERLGEKYRYYFIDEFQDTSQMQWNNLQPLISHALESETLYGKRGSLCVVGDAKQAIYRWRGGKPEQFMGLYGDHNPFQVEKEVVSLPRNYRSFDTIVRFNNEFFSHIALLLTHPQHRDLYEHKSFQETNNKEGGMVTLAFMEKTTTPEDYCERVLHYIRQAVAQGFAYHDICVLTRKRKEGIMVARYLSEHHIRIISSETLLLKNNPEIDFLIHLMLHSLEPSHKEYRVQLLHFLAARQNTLEKHDFLVSYLKDFDAILHQYSFDNQFFMQLPLFDAMEYAIHAFELAADSDGYLQFFLDEVMDFTAKKGGGFSNFITHWERKKDTLSITAPQAPGAVQIMTIHKAKGLEFPVVIYPFANTNMYDERQPKVWFPVDKDRYGIPYALLNKNRDLRELGQEAAEMYDELQSKLELDQVNILYVVLTRAVERLYVITKKDTDSKGVEKLHYFSGLFIHYLKSKLLWNTGETEYVFGTATPAKTARKKEFYTDMVPFLFHTAHKKRFEAGNASGKHAEEATKRYRLLRSIVSEITHATDIEEVIDNAYNEGILLNRQKKESRALLNAIVTHKEIAPYYTSAYTIYNEREIYTHSGEVIRPDRMALQNNNAAIIEYKTGTFKEDDLLQFAKYEDAMNQMNITVTHKILVYINDGIEVRVV